MRHLSAALLCAALSAPALAAAQQPAPLKMGLITAGLDAGAAAALDRVIAASPLIERRAAAPPPVEDTDAARAAWLRANKLEGAILAAQAGDEVTLTAIGPLGEVLGREVMAVGADDVEAQRALQRAAGLIGPPVLLYRSQRPVEEPKLPVEEPMQPVPKERPAAQASPAERPRDGRGRIAIGVLASPLHSYSRTSETFDGQPRPDRAFDELPMVAGLHLSISPDRGDPTALDKNTLWLRLAALTSFEPTTSYKRLDVAFGGMISGDDAVQIGTGMGLRYESFDAVDVAYSVEILIIDMFNLELRWQLLPDALILNTSMFMALALPMGDPEVAIGIGLGGRAELRYLLGDLFYAELLAQTSQTFLGFGNPLSERLNSTSLALGVGMSF